jgi:hypothetical protein
MSNVESTPETAPQPRSAAEKLHTNWHRFAAWLVGRRTEEVTPLATGSNPDVLRFETPALGDAYEFKISIRCDWQLDTIRDWRGESIVLPAHADALDQARVEIRPRLQDAARHVVRRFPPHRPADAERALAEALAAGLVVNGLRCHAVACVGPPDEILAQLRAHWQEQLAYELRSDRSEVLAEQVGRLRRIWQAFLLDSLNPEPGPAGEDVGWLVPHALELAERPQELAVKMSEITKQRHDQATGLATDLTGVLSRSQDLDVLEFLMNTDSALRATMRLLGVSLPPLAEGSALKAAQATQSP